MENPQEKKPLEFSEKELKLIRSQNADLTEQQFEHFIWLARATGLNPLAGQLVPQLRNDKRTGTKKLTTITSIDGYRLIATRSGKYRGQKGPFWCGEDGEWKDAWVSNEFPVAAKVGILRADFDEIMWGVARFDSYVQMYNNTPSGLWGKMPDLMTAKCAEALAFRKAFPDELSAIYTADEMMQASNDNAHEHKAQKKEQAPAKQEGSPQGVPPQQAPAVDPDRPRKDALINLKRYVKQHGLAVDKDTWTDFVIGLTNLRNFEEQGIDVFEKSLKMIQEAVEGQFLVKERDADWNAGFQGKAETLGALIRYAYEEGAETVMDYVQTVIDSAPIADSLADLSHVETRKLVESVWREMGAESLEEQIKAATEPEPEQASATEPEPARQEEIRTPLKEDDGFGL